MSNQEKDPSLQEEQTVMSKKEKRDTEFLNMMNKTQSTKEPNNGEKKEKNKSVFLVDKEMNHLLVTLSSNVLKALNWINHAVDYALASGTRISLLSIMLTVVMSYFIYGNSSVGSTKSIDYIYEVPVTVIAPENYEILGVDDTVSLQVVGDYSSIQWAKVMKEYQVVLDVSGKQEGDYDISYRVDGLSTNIQATVSPEYCHVNISKLETDTFELTYMFDNLAQADQGLKFKDPILNIDTCEITAGKTTLSRIDKVVAKIDASTINETSHHLSAPIVALDSNGNELKVSINPEIVSFDIDVVSYSKVVPVVLDVVGEVDSNYVLSSITPNITSVTISGLEEDLAEITQVVAKVDVSNTSSNISINGVTITLPDKITKVSERTISVEIKVEKKEQRVFENIPISIESLSPQYKATIIGDKNITLRISGPKTKIDALKEELIKVYVDLSDAKVGTTKYDLLVANQDNSLSYEFENHTSIDISIQESQ